MISPAHPLLALIATTLAACSSTAGLHTQRFEYTQIIMGGQARITLYATDEAQARSAARLAFDRMATLDRVMSDYRPGSEVMRLCDVGAPTPVIISKDLFQVLEMAQEISAASDGAFDVTIGPLTRLWRVSQMTERFPDTEELEQAKARTGWQHLTLDRTTQTVQFGLQSMLLDLGAIGKGYAADEAVATLYDAGIGRCLVELGGDVSVGRPPPNELGWRVEVPSLQTADGEARVFLLKEAGVATSGDSERHVIIDSTRYSHILDPHTGLGLTDSTTVTVIARSAALADALASAISVVGPGQATAVLVDYPEASVLVEK